MPVYNSEKYLKNAVESILNQDFEDFELILVDDGSSDGSPKICDQFADKNEKVVVIHKPNGGICSARNAGLSAARGEYIGFCDNDDKYLPGLLADNYEIAKKNNVDLMRYSKIKRIEKEDGRIFEIHRQAPDIIIEKEDFYRNYRTIRIEDTVWTGLYRKKIIDQNQIRFDEQFKYGSEDLNFNLKFLKHCKRLGFNSGEYYLWTQREVHSTSRKFHREYLEKYIINMNLEHELLTEACEGKVDNYTKNNLLVNTYVYPLVEYMTLKTCDMSKKEKVAYLKKLRENAIFDKKIPQSTLTETRKKNIRVYITMLLFDRRRYKILLVVLKYGIAFMDMLRFKKK